MVQCDHGHTVDNSRQCHAMKKAGGQCANPPLMGTWFCAVHGGQAAAHRAKYSEDLRLELLDAQYEGIPTLESMGAQTQAQGARLIDALLILQKELQSKRIHKKLVSSGLPQSVLDALSVIIVTPKKFIKNKSWILPLVE